MERTRPTSLRPSGRTWQGSTRRKRHSLPTELAELVDFCSKGCCRAETCDPELMPLGLTPDVKAQLVAFLNAR